MLESMKPVNYAEMLPPTVQVALFGEMRHNISEYKFEMINILPILKNLGFTHLCVEMLPFSMQNKLDEYSKNNKYADDVIKFLKENWGWNKNSSQAILYARIIEKAQALGMKIIGLDLMVDQFQQFDTCTAEQLHSIGQCTQSSHLVRNQIMATIMETVVRKGGRCVAFMHYYHAVKNLYFETGIRTLLNKQAVSTKTIRLLHPDFGFDECTKDVKRITPVISEAYKHSVEKDRFYIEGHLSSDSRGEDYIVYLPCK